MVEKDETMLKDKLTVHFFKSTVVHVAGGFIFLSVSLFYIYIISVHRITSISDAWTAVEVMSLPVHNYRCRTVNGTHFRCLPNVFFIGASKCGTTSLVRYLDQHPLVALQNRRISKDDGHMEVHRFDRKTYEWAIKSIDVADEWASTPYVTDPSIPVVHYTPHYLYAPSVPFELRDFYDHPKSLKFIVIMREPIDRAISSYWYKNSAEFKGKNRGS